MPSTPITPYRPPTVNNQDVLTCWNCFEEGHKRRDCPHNRYQKNNIEDEQVVYEARSNYVRAKEPQFYSINFSHKGRESRDALTTEGVLRSTRANPWKE